MNRKILVVDWSNIMYRAWWSSQKDIELKPWLPLLRFVDMVRTAAQRSKCNELIFAGESRKKLKRTNIDSTYKSTRKPTQDPQFKFFRQACADIVKDFGCNIVSIDGAEADDVIASIVDKHCHLCNCKQRCVDCEHTLAYSTEIVIFSNDQDMNQLLAYDRVTIYRHPGVLYSREDFMEEYGFDPKHFTVYKALIGDKSDNIQGCEGFGPVKAKESVVRDTVDKDVEFSDNEEAFDKALKLITLDYGLDLPDDTYTPLFDSDIMSSRNILLTLPLEMRDVAIEEIRTAILRLEAVCF